MTADPTTPLQQAIAEAKTACDTAFACTTNVEALPALRHAAAAVRTLHEALGQHGAPTELVSAASAAAKSIDAQIDKAHRKLELIGEITRFTAAAAELATLGPGDTSTTH